MNSLFLLFDSDEKPWSATPGPALTSGGVGLVGARRFRQARIKKLKR